MFWMYMYIDCWWVLASTIHVHIHIKNRARNRSTIYAYNVYIHSIILNGAINTKLTKQLSRPCFLILDFIEFSSNFGLICGPAWPSRSRCYWYHWWPSICHKWPAVIWRVFKGGTCLYQHTVSFLSLYSIQCTMYYIQRT